MYYARWIFSVILFVYFGFMVWFIDKNYKPFSVILPHEFVVEDFKPDWAFLYQEMRLKHSVNARFTIEFWEHWYARGGVDLFLVDGNVKIIVGSYFANCWPDQIEQTFIKNLGAALINFDEVPSSDTKLVISPFSVEHEGQECEIPKIKVKSVELCD